MIEGIIASGLCFIGFSIIMSGIWISVKLEILENIKNELDNIRLEIQYLDKK